jgi:limonene-1,2-epoxide hydrolase
MSINIREIPMKPLLILMFSTLILQPITYAAENVHINHEGKTMVSKIETYLSIIEIWKGKDVEAVLAHLTDDVIWHYAAAIEPPLRSKQEARVWLTKFGGAVTDSKWRVINYSETETQLFIEGIEEYMTPAGIRIVLPYSGVYDFKGSKISGWRDYFDRGLTNRLQEGEAVPDFVEELAAKSAVQ